MKGYLRQASILSLLVLVLLSACSSDDEGTSTLAIVGAYTLTQESVSGCNDAAENVTENKSCTGTDCETLVIKSNNVFTITVINGGVSNSTEGTYSLSGNQITFTYVENSLTINDVVTYMLDGGVLVLSADAGDGCVESETYSKN